ncbi:MAG: orotate phosphoribosyltransferase [Bacteroidales bacterium]|nr:orotate phosphoribosyltransferase [Bacteroidales bacterium]
MEITENLIAKTLLQINAIKLNPTNPYTWASGWKSPIYCDNRKILSFPKARDIVKKAFADLIKEKYGNVDVIAGVATGAIAHGALVADLLNLPFIYVRSSSKGHGLENLIEGVLEAGQKVVVIEDLISTGGSSIKAVEAIREKNAQVLGMMAIFSYGFEIALNNFKNAQCQLDILSNYNTLLKIAIETGYIKSEQLETLNNWRNNPENWMK